MAQVKIDKNSWLNLTNLLKWNDYTFWDHFDFPDVPHNDNDVYVQLTSVGAHRLDLIANDAYGEPRLMWIILLANDLFYPNQLYDGMTLRIPAPETVETIFANAKK